MTKGVLQHNIDILNNQNTHIFKNININMTLNII